MIICGIIWADRVALRGAEAVVGCKELVIVTIKKRHIRKTQIENLAKLSFLRESHLIEKRIGKQRS